MDATKDEAALEPTEPPSGGDWPALMRARPHVIVSNTAIVVVIAWIAMLVVDVFPIRASNSVNPLWTLLFNDGFIEWGQWFLLPTTVLAAAYLASRLHTVGDRGAASFYFLFAVAAGLMMIEDAGDIRHTLRSYAVNLGGQEILGIRTGLLIEVPYFALLAAVPIYALVRYGRHAWRSPATRPYLVAGFGLYAFIGSANGFRILGDVYVRVGRWIDTALFGGRFPVPPGQPPEFGHFYLVDGPIEESIELVAASCFVAIVLAFAADLRAGRVLGDQRTPTASGG